MITFPCAKINLGLNVIAAREDGYHDIETVFYPIPITDALEIKYMDEHFPSEYNCDLKITGNAVDCDEQHNLVVKAYDLLAANYEPAPHPCAPCEAHPHAGGPGWRIGRRGVHDQAP